MNKETAQTPEVSWARISVRVPTATFPLDHVERVLGRQTHRYRKDGTPSPHWWIARFAPTGEEPLEDQLLAVKEFLAANLDALRSLDGQGEINVFIGWTPRRGQDSVAFDPELIALVAQVGGFILLDTHTDDCDHECD
ncbi:MAG TPA: hypothetical protein VM677_10990 [Actinokineospora sp.]|jgi:hypothetical protein|nr:hypothetical protein [Actinokineospora sp.]